MSVVKTILKLYLLIIGVFTILRMVLLINNINLIPLTSSIDAFIALFLGLRFDIVVTGYILLPSFIYLSISSIINHQIHLIKRIHLIYLVIIPSIAFLVSAANIPFFTQFFQHINSSVFQYFDEYNYVFRMIIGEPSYWIYFILFTVLMIAYLYGLKFVLRKHQDDKFHQKKHKHITILVTALIFILLGIRGRIEGKSPIRTGTASFTNNSFLNKLGLNANFTLMTSVIRKLNQSDAQIKYMNKDDALKIVLQEIKSPSLTRKITVDSVVKKSNVVLVIMESMAAVKMERYGNKEGLTPFLDSISNYGYSFDQTYTAGIHTFNGVFSTLYSMLSAYDYHPMKESFGKEFPGLPTTLKDLGYHTSFYTTHDGQFDNMEGFLYQNGFDEIISLEDYPNGKNLSKLGVPDDFMFDFGVKRIDKIAEKNANFLAVFLTASDHGPFVVPEYFNSSVEGIQKQIIQYADWSLKRLIEEASNRDWFDNTYFVFIADHGSWDYALYQMPLTYHHSPFIIYAPKLIDSAISYSNLTSQIDLYPTLMGILKQSYVNQSMGVDVRDKARKFLCFTSDETLGIIDGNNFFYSEISGNKHLFKYKERSLTNDVLLDEKDSKELEKVLMANFQVAMEIIAD